MKFYFRGDKLHVHLQYIQPMELIEAVSGVTLIKQYKQEVQ